MPYALPDFMDIYHTELEKCSYKGFHVSCQFQIRVWLYDVNAGKKEMKQHLNFPKTTDLFAVVFIYFICPHS